MKTLMLLIATLVVISSAQARTSCPNSDIVLHYAYLKAETVLSPSYPVKDILFSEDKVQDLGAGVEIWQIQFNAKAFGPTVSVKVENCTQMTAL